MTRYASLMSLFLMAILTLLACTIAFAEPSMPKEVFTFEMIAEKIRSPLSEKMSEMRMTYRMLETPVGKDAAKIDFLNEKDQMIARIYFERSLNAEKTERMEEVRLVNASGKTLIKETVFTNGTELEYSKPNERIFFETNTANYGLAKTETSKTVILGIDGVEVMRFASVQISSRTNSKLQLSDIFFGGTKLLTISDAVSNDGNFRALKYDIVGTAYTMRGFGVQFGGRGWPTYGIRVEASRPAGYLVDNHRFYLDDTEIFGLNKYVKTFGEEIFEPFVISSGVSFLNMVIQHYYPATQRTANLAAANYFLDELVLLRSQLSQAATSPAMLTIITTTITGFIDAFQKGTLSITDTRPRQ